MVGDERPGRGAARHRLHHRRLDLDVVARGEEAPQVGDRRGARPEDAPDVRVDDEVDVALAVAGLDVHEPVPFLGQRPERLGEQPDVVGLDGEFARPRAERPAADADHVAEIERPVELEGRLAQAVAARVDLDASRAVLEVEEPRLAEVAQADDAPRDAHRRDGRERRFGEPLAPGMEVARRVIRAEVVRVRVHSPRPQRLQLLPPDHALLVVFGHRGWSRAVVSTGFSPERQMYPGARAVLAPFGRCGPPMPPDPVARARRSRARLLCSPGSRLALARFAGFARPGTALRGSVEVGRREVLSRRTASAASPCRGLRASGRRSSRSATTSRRGGGGPAWARRASRPTRSGRCRHPWR